MKNKTLLILLATFVAILPGCKREIVFEEPSRIVERTVGHERFENGTKKWEFYEILGPDGPYTDLVNGNFNGSRGILGSEHGGEFTVANRAGSATRKLNIVKGVSYMAIPVQNQKLENGIIVCRSIAPK